MKKALLFGILILTVVGLAHAVRPSSQMNYQGVLRDASDKPLDGTYNMVFRFFGADVGGDEILVDTHTGVVVADGLFNVRLGGIPIVAEGVVTDGSGPGHYTYLPAVFGAYNRVHLEVEVNGELLLPRTPIVSAPSALNARYVNGVNIADDGPLTLYVDAVFGDDNNSGLYPAAAFETVQAAMNRVPPILTGDVTIDIADGTYHESLFIDRRIRTGPYFIHLVGNVGAPENVVFDGQSTLEDAILSLDLLWVRGITFTGYVEQAVEAYNALVWLEHSVVVGNGLGGNAAIESNGGASMSITNCVITNNPGGGIDASGGSKISVGGCDISSNGGVGVKANGCSEVSFDESGPLTITNNALEGAVAANNSQIDFSGRADLTISGNAGGPMSAHLHSTIKHYSNGTTGTCTPDAYSVCLP